MSQTLVSGLSQAQSLHRPTRGGEKIVQAGINPQIFMLWVWVFSKGVSLGTSCHVWVVPPDKGGRGEGSQVGQLHIVLVKTNILWLRWCG